VENILYNIVSPQNIVMDLNIVMGIKSSKNIIKIVVQCTLTFITDDFM
jgi:hypothetical protein